VDIRIFIHMVWRRNSGRRTGALELNWRITVMKTRRRYVTKSDEKNTELPSIAVHFGLGTLHP
jgi:hypothetical protein